MGIVFTHLRQAVKLRQSGWLRKHTGPLYQHIFTGEKADKFQRFPGMSRESGNRQAGSSQGTHTTCLTTRQQSNIELVSDWRPCRLAVDGGYRPIAHKCSVAGDPSV